MKSSPHAWAAGALLAAGLGAPALGCSRPPARPNVILISLDTVRADRLSLHGYAVRTSPRLEAFARNATVFTRAQAAAAWTVPSHASMFTGRFPFEHGAHTLPPESGAAVRPLHGNSVTLAEVLQRLGYQTAAVVANAGYLAPRFKLNQGFSTYVVEWGPWEVVNGHVREWLASRAPDQPFFLFVNYMDAHGPYNAKARPGLLPRPVVHDKGGALTRLYRAAMPATQPVPPELIQAVSDQYDTALANLDEGLGQLLDTLDAQGLLKDATVVVTSDHGEFIGEHFLVEHSKDVYQEALWIPLVVKGPAERGRKDDARLASHVDIPRLVLSTLGPDLVRDHLAQFPYTVGSHPVIGQCYYTRAKDLFRKPWSGRFNRVRTALFDERLKLIASSDGQHELYDLKVDPREATNLMASRTEAAQRMLHALESFRRSRTEFRGREEAAPQPSEEDLEQLRALGYVGGADEEGGETGPRR